MNVSRHGIGAPSLTVELESPDDRAALARTWGTLERDADASFFLSWGWIECWLANLPSSVEPKLLHVRENGRTVGLAVLVEQVQRRRGFVRSRRLLLHESGDPGLDRIFIEHNGLLASRGRESEVMRAGLSFLQNSGRWDEIFLSGVSLENRELPVNSGVRAVERSVQAAFVDLEAIRRHGGNYLESLGKNTRYAIRRSLRLYKRRGPIELRAADTLEEGFSFFESMAWLHQRYWTSRGEPGVFAEPAFRRFHTRLITSRFAAGEIQLLRAAAGATTIGYLYNFRKSRHIYQYQCGFTYEESPHLKPGLVSHYLAVQDSLDRGDDVYDFLAGDDRYKRNLANDTHRLVWLTLQRDQRQFRLEAALQQLWRSWLRR